MQPLEQCKDPLLILGLDADAVVAYAERPRCGRLRCRDMHPRRFVRVVELDGIGDQVLEYLAQLSRIT